MALLFQGLEWHVGGNASIIGQGFGQGLSGLYYSKKVGKVPIEAIYWAYLENLAQYV